MAEYIDKALAQTELMMNAERYTVAHESNGFGTVEWSDNLIPVWKVMEILRNMPSIEDAPVVRCRDCKYRYTDGDNVTANYCLLNHARVQADDWFCADAEREEE